MHFVWGTKDRQPLLTEEIRGPVHAAIVKKCRELGCEVLAVGSVEDHLHLLVEMRPSVAPSDLVRAAKGVSSHLVNHQLNPSIPFRWQENYGVFSLTKNGLPRLREYVLNQREHHERGSTHKELETF
jgi:REP element-mobilizing transposase RayT